MEYFVRAFFVGSLVLGPLIAVFGLAIGIASLFQSNRRKVFGIIGTLLNGLFVLGAVAFIFVVIIKILQR